MIHMGEVVNPDCGKQTNPIEWQRPSNDKGCLSFMACLTWLHRQLLRHTD